MAVTRLTSQREPQLAAWARAASPSDIQQLLALAARPEVLSFALGLPAPELFPAQDYATAMGQTLAGDPRAMQYGPTPARLKEHVVALMASRGVRCEPEQIVLTTGAQQGLALLAHLLIEPASGVVIERLAYSGFRQLLDLFRPRVLRVPTDPDQGLDPERLEQLLAQGPRPALIYTVSEGHNPLGISLSAERRIRLAELARAYGVPIIEDDPYGFLRYDDPAPLPIRAYDDEWVYYVGSFSKILAPALRVGWLVVPRGLVARLEVAKEASDINTATLSQRALVAYLDAGHLDAHLLRLRGVYRQRRDALLRALEVNFGGLGRWTRPASGMFLWLELEGAIDTRHLLARALAEERIAFLPGAAFSADDDRSAAHAMRLSFATATPEVIADGVVRLARVARALAAA